MFNLLILIGALCFITNGFSYPVKIEYSFPFVSREGWGARRATGSTPLNKPVFYVVIHHSYEPGACYIQDDCASAMRNMQDYHQLDQGWNDIGYNFAVGSDGVVYEGRGWNNVGAHAVGYNPNSIGIVLIGNWISELPPYRQLQAVQKLIYTGVLLHYISYDYALIGHRQVSDTECPGDRLFNELTNWKNFDGNNE